MNIQNKIKGIDLFENNNYNDISNLINEIRQNKNNIEQNKLEEYIKKVEYLCCNYEKWFYDKTGRKKK